MPLKIITCYIIFTLLSHCKNFLLGISAFEYTENVWKRELSQRENTFFISVALCKAHLHLQIYVYGKYCYITFQS